MGSSQSRTGDLLPQEAQDKIPRHGARSYPQETFADTVIERDSFYGKTRRLYADKVLKTELDHLHAEGTYDSFRLRWSPKYDIRPLHGAMCPIQGSPPTLARDSDIGKWLEAACYFLASPDGHNSAHAQEITNAVEELVDMMVSAQQPDGYLGTYFTVVDPKGKLKNLRDMHEMYCCGHLLEGALAHHRLTGSTRFLDVMIRYVSLLCKMFGPEKGQRHGYPGHPELEQAMCRLYARTGNPSHLAFAKYLVETRGVLEPDLGYRSYFVWEAEQRKDPYFHRAVCDRIDDGRYAQWHAPLHDQDSILGHAVRAMYLITAAADFGGDSLEDARRLWTDAVDNKMYSTGGFGSVPRNEGFSDIPHFLPNSQDEGGCYAETCASIGAMMVSERLLSYRLDGKVRDVLERCLLNTVLGGASLDGQQFYYDNPLATWGENKSERSDWFEVSCCPPNLARTMGLLGGYTWSTQLDETENVIHLDVYLYLSAKRQILLPDGRSANVTMSSEMPWQCKTVVSLEAPGTWSWIVNLPHPDYAEDFVISGAQGCVSEVAGYNSCDVASRSSLSVSFSMPIRFLSPHPDTHQDTLTLTRGAIVYTAESVDNHDLDERSPHFARVGIKQDANIEEMPMEIHGISMMGLRIKPVYLKQWLGKVDIGSTRAVTDSAVRSWTPVEHGMTMVPFFARSNRGGAGRLRTAFSRVSCSDVQREDQPVRL